MGFVGSVNFTSREFSSGMKAEYGLLPLFRFCQPERMRDYELPQLLSCISKISHNSHTLFLIFINII